LTIGIYYGIMFLLRRGRKIMKPIENFDGYFIDENGNVYSTQISSTPKKLKPGITNCGYLQVHLAQNGKYITLTFIGLLRVHLSQILKTNRKLTTKMGISKIIMWIILNG
jgi:NUMOD4 motif.